MRHRQKPQRVCRYRLNPDPILKLVAAVPFRNKGNKEVQFVMQYGGKLDLARRAWPSLSVATDVVYEGDDYILRRGLIDEYAITRRHWEKGIDPGRILFASCVTRIEGQPMPTLTIVPGPELETLRAKALARQSSSPWSQHFEAMCKKTAIHRASTTWPVDPDSDLHRLFMESRADDDADEIEPPQTSPDPEPGGQTLVGNPTPRRGRGRPPKAQALPEPAPATEPEEYPATEGGLPDLDGTEPEPPEPQPAATDTDDAPSIGDERWQTLSTVAAKRAKLALGKPATEDQLTKIIAHAVPNPNDLDTMTDDDFDARCGKIEAMAFNALRTLIA